MIARASARASATASARTSTRARANTSTTANARSGWDIMMWWQWASQMTA